MGLIGIPLMLSPNTTKVVREIVAFIYKILYPATAKCERIQWCDVPAGPLLQCKQDCAGSGEERQGSDCLKTTLGNFFQRAWVSASLRNMSVTKPKQLSLDTQYVRTDQKLVQAYLLLNRYNDGRFRDDIVQFRDIDGILTAHLLNTLPPYMHSCTQTKREIELILEGYPPQYTEHVLIPQDELPKPSTQWTCIASPIEGPPDIYRGGWVVAVGLNWNHNSVNRRSGTARSTWPVIGHNMEPISQDTPGRESVKDFKPRQMGVHRVRHVFHEIRKSFPEQETIVRAALEFIHPYFSCCPDEIEPWLDPLNVPPPVAELANGLPVPRSYSEVTAQLLIKKAKLFAAPYDSFYSQGYSRRLSGPEWTIIMRIFNRFGPLASEDIEFLRPRLVSVLQAAAVGIWELMGDKRKASMTRLPEIPELHARRHIYVYDCKGSEHHDEVATAEGPLGAQIYVC